jgi:hypothetical protein
MRCFDKEPGHTASEAKGAGAFLTAVPSEELGLRLSRQNGLWPSAKESGVSFSNPQPGAPFAPLGSWTSGATTLLCVTVAGTASRDTTASSTESLTT